MVMEPHLKNLVARYPQLAGMENIIADVYKMIEKCLRAEGTLFICGNGGSAADSEHMVGELLKGFKMKREINQELKNKFEEKFGEEGKDIAEKLQGGLRAISLSSHPAFSTAFANDVDADLVFGQQLFALGHKGDVLLGFTTSGNSKNVVKAMQVAHIKGINTIAMTGASGGKVEKLATYTIKAPETETYKVQELHLPIYHTICLIIEEHFYGK